MQNHSNRKLTQEQIYGSKVTLDKFPSLSKEVPAKQGEGEKKMADEQKGPEHVRVGCIDVTIWTNNGGRGDFKNVTIQRSYKDKDEKWQHTPSLKTNDIPKAILALQKAYEKIVMKEKE